MSDSLFSQFWYRVEFLKPRLRGHARIHRHCYRHRDWYVLQDHFSGRCHRFSPEAYTIIGMMDGRRTLTDIWSAACETLGDDMPTQDEVISLLSQLHRSDVLQCDIPPDIREMYLRQAHERRNRLIGYLLSPMSVRFPLIDPDRFLRATMPLVRPIFSWTGALIWTVTVCYALALVITHWGELTDNLADRVLSMENLVLLSWVYPLVKAIHELGHGYAVKLRGGEVHEMGIMLLVFMPVPYVDASASSAFPEKTQRILVSAAGILTELFLAAVAAVIWINVEPGPVRAVAYNIMLTAGVSSVLFNGNPLLRFDGYYILSDFLEIPNLASGGNRYVGYLLQHYLLGIKQAQRPPASRGEARWMIGYTIAAFVYRIFITVRIVLFVAGKFFVIGVLLAVWGAFSMVVSPLIRMGRHVMADNRFKGKRFRILVTAGVVLSTVSLFISVVPVPFFSIAEGVIWVPEQYRVYAEVDGFIDEVLIGSGQRVSRGDALIRCSNDRLRSEGRVLEAQFNEYEARHRASLMGDRTETDILKEEMDRVQAELQQVTERLNELTIRSPVDGAFLLAQEEDYPGRFVSRGTQLGYVVDYAGMTVRALVPQKDVDLVRGRTRHVEIRLAGLVDREMESSIAREVPGATTDLPSLALSLEGGGTIALDPRENEQPQAYQKMFQFDLSLPSSESYRVGERVFIRFEYEPEPLAWRWFRSVRRVFLSRFEV